MNWPLVVACLAFVAGMALIVAGTYVLAGLGWSLLAGAGSCFLLGFVILRGLRGQ